MKTKNTLRENKPQKKDKYASYRNAAQDQKDRPTNFTETGKKLPSSPMSVAKRRCLFPRRSAAVPLHTLQMPRLKET